MKSSCLATVTDDRFAIGTEVLLYSFLKHNPWFEGDVVLLIDTLSDAARQRLEALHPVRLVRHDPRLEAKSGALQARIPSLGDIHLRFLSLEAFRLFDYEKVVFLDSDIFCMGDIAELFERREPLLASYDGYSYQDRLDPVLEKAGLPTIGSPERYGQEYERSMSSGVMALTGEALTEETYFGLLDAMERYDPGDRLVFTDQMVLNTYFKDRFTPISGKYNYRVLLEDYIRCLDGVGFLDARLVHFSGAVKPWNEYRPEDLLRYGAQYLKFIDVWRELFEEVRHRGDADYMARRILAQLRLIERDGSEAVPEVLGRLE